MFDLLATVAFWSSAVTGATPIAFAALGALLASRSGSLFVGVEGTLLGSSFVALAVTAQTGSTWLGVAAGFFSGAALGVVNGLLSMQLRMGDVVAGLILQILVLGVTGLLVARWFPNGLAAGAHQIGPPWQGTGIVPVDVVVRQPVLVYVAVAVAVAMAVFLRSRLGLVVRASGDSLRVAYTLRIPVARVCATTRSPQPGRSPASAAPSWGWRSPGCSRPRSRADAGSSLWPASSWRPGAPSSPSWPPSASPSPTPSAFRPPIRHWLRFRCSRTS